jgi:hypothetical protein
MNSDKERLDWLESQGYAIRSRYWGIRNLVVWGQYGKHHFGIRDAIDCAMKRHALYIKGARTHPRWCDENSWCRTIKGQPF